MPLKEYSKIYKRRKSQEGKRLQIWLSYLDWGALQKIKKL